MEEILWQIVNFNVFFLFESSEILSDFLFFRVIKNVKVEASFQPLDKNVLEKYKSGNWSILEFPVLHLFISECNVRQLEFVCFFGDF